MIRRFAAGLALLTLAGCATTGTPGAATDPFALLQKFTTDDLQAALDDAKAHGDPAGALCWATLLEVAGTSLPAAPTIKGAASAIQVKRDLMSAGTGALAKHINLGCAALFNDEAATLAKMGAPLLGIPALPF